MDKQKQIDKAVELITNELLAAIKRWRERAPTIVSRAAALGELGELANELYDAIQFGTISEDRLK